MTAVNPARFSELGSALLTSSSLRGILLFGRSSRRFVVSQAAQRTVLERAGMRAALRTRTYGEPDERYATWLDVVVLVDNRASNVVLPTRAVLVHLRLDVLTRDATPDWRLAAAIALGDQGAAHGSGEVGKPVVTCDAIRVSLDDAPCLL